MTGVLKRIIKRFLPQGLIDLRKRRSDQKQLSLWLEKGKPVPPPHMVKQLTIREYREKFGINTLVETGTYLGDMVEAMKNDFKKIYSIELGADLHARAVNRFLRHAHVTLIQGDSGQVIEGIVQSLQEDALFWLDGHYSAGITARGEKISPILMELRAILAQKGRNHVILIDDARLFTGEDDYPTLDELKTFIKSNDSRYAIEVKDDIIRCTADVKK